MFELHLSKWVLERYRVTPNSQITDLLVWVSVIPGFTVSHTHTYTYTPTHPHTHVHAHKHSHTNAHSRRFLKIQLLALPSPLCSWLFLDYKSNQTLWTHKSHSHTHIFFYLFLLILRYLNKEAVRCEQLSFLFFFPAAPAEAGHEVGLSSIPHMCEENRRCWDHVWGWRAALQSTWIHPASLSLGNAYCWMIYSSPPGFVLHNLHSYLSLCVDSGIAQTQGQRDSSISLGGIDSEDEQVNRPTADT